MTWSDAARAAAAEARRMHSGKGVDAPGARLPAKIVHMRGTDTVVRQDKENFYTRKGRDIEKADVTHVQYQGGKMRPFKGGK